MRYPLLSTVTALIIRCNFLPRPQRAKIDEKRDSVWAVSLDLLPFPAQMLALHGLFSMQWAMSPNRKLASLTNS